MKSTITILAILFIAFLFTSCSETTRYVEFITLNQTELTMTVGDPAVTLTATVQPRNPTNKNLWWSSSNTNVVTVDENGRVTAVRQGEARITVQDVYSGARAECIVTVQPRPGSPTGISLSRSNIRLGVGGMETLIATITPADAVNQNVTWSSNNASVAVDDNGVVTVLRVGGGATITATTVDGGLTATATVGQPYQYQMRFSAPTYVVLNSGETHRFTWVLPTGGCPGGVTYLWQMSSDGQTWVNAPGINTGREYTTPPVTANTYFRRLTTDDCGVTFSFEATKVLMLPTWATRNVGAPGTFVDNPEDFGMFFQWNRRQGWPATGDVTGWNNTREGVGGVRTWSVANDPCPEGWRIPTAQEFQVLVRSGSQSVSNWNGTGVNGRLFGTAPNQIFLPSTGYRSWSNGARNDRFGLSFNYWSSSTNRMFFHTVALPMHFTGTSVGGTSAIFDVFDNRIEITHENIAINSARGFPVRCVAIE